MPTILDVLKIGVPASLQGESLLPLIKKKYSKGFDSYAETYFPLLSNGWAPLKAVSTERYKFIKAPKPELYDLLADPHELENIIKERPGIAKEMEDKLEKLEVYPVKKFIFANRYDFNKILKLQNSKK